jgi:hypothetical protein
LNPPDPALSPSAVHYAQTLMDAGWICIGAGVGGEVFHRQGDPDVIKVSDGDECYVSFAAYAQANPMTCLPRLRIVHSITFRWTVTHIEFLQHITLANEKAVESWWNLYVIAKRNNAPFPQPNDWSIMATALWPIAKTNNCGFDMKAVNVMQRGNDVVFIDPMN